MALWGIGYDSMYVSLLFAFLGTDFNSRGLCCDVSSFFLIHLSPIYGLQILARQLSTNYCEPI